MEITDWNTQFLFMDDYVVLDLEMTGLDSDKDAITEIGIQRIRDRKAVASYQTLVKPNRYIRGYISKKTGITNEMVAKDGKDLDVALKETMAFIGEDVIVGQNIRYDILFLSKALGYPVTNPLVDTWRISRILIPEQRHRLTDLVSYFRIENDLAFHRALNDVDNTAKVFEAEKALILERYKTYEAFIRNPHPTVTPEGIPMEKTENLAIYATRPWQVRKDNEACLYPPYIWNKKLRDVSQLKIDYEDPEKYPDSLNKAFVYDMADAKTYRFFKEKSGRLADYLIRQHSHLSERERKDSTACICFTMITVDDYLRYQKLGIHVFHISDVLAYIRSLKK